MWADLHFYAKVCAMSETSWERLYRLAEARRGQLGITQNGLQGLGGPSAEWLRQLPGRTGDPSPRMSSSLRDLDQALGWPAGTSWGLVKDDRTGWIPAMLEDEEETLVYGASQSDAENDLRNFETIVLAALRAMPLERREQAMRDITRLLGL